MQPDSELNVAIQNAAERLWELIDCIDAEAGQRGQIEQNPEAEKYEWLMHVDVAIGDCIRPLVEQRDIERRDLAMIIRRLCKRFPKNDGLAETALDYLKRKGLQGSPIRKGEST